MAAAARWPSFVIAGLAAAAVALQGCATPGHPVEQTVRVETPGCPAAHCELSNDVGRWVVDPTPGSVTLTTSLAPLQVRCSAGAQGQGRTDVAAAAQSATGGGAVAGGLAGGAAAGAAVGAVALSFIPVLGAVILLTGVAAGAAAGQAVESGQQPIRYTDLVVVPMTCPSDTGAAAGPGPAPLGLAIGSLTPAQGREAGIGERSAVVVLGVAEGSRAAAAGLRPGDIVLGGQGRGELFDAAQLEAWVQSLPVGGSISLRIWRRGGLMELVLDTARPAPTQPTLPTLPTLPGTP